MKKKGSFIVVLMIIFVCFASFAGVQNTTITAKAGETRYALTYDESVTTKYVTAETGVSKTVYMTNSLYENLVAITYDRVTSAIEGSENLVASEGKITTAGVTVLEENVAVNTNNIQPVNESKMRYYFRLPTVHECCAYVFTVFYNGGGSTQTSYESKILYVNNIDSVAPTASLTQSYPSSGKYKGIFTLSDYSENKVSSGIQGYTLYQSDLQGKNKVQYGEPVTFSQGRAKWENQTVLLDIGQYNYYMLLTDFAGNQNEQQIATFDYDDLMNKGWNALEVMTNTSEQWSNSFIFKMQLAFTDYSNAFNERDTIGEEVFLQKKNSLEQMIEEYKAIVKNQTAGVVSCDIQVKNGEYLQEDPTFPNISDALQFLKNGEEGTLVISIGKYDGKGQDLSNLSMSKADEKYILSLTLSGTDEANIKQDFSLPLQIKINLGDFEEIEAVQTVEENGEKVTFPCLLKRYTDGTVVVLAEKTYGDIAIYVKREQQANLKYLYLLFLLIPIAGGTILLVYFKKKKKKTEEKTVSENKE